MKNFKLTNNDVLAYNDYGTGENVLVAIHGNMSSSKQFNNLVLDLDGDFRVITPDLRGFGESSYFSSVNSFEEYADDVIELLAHLNIQNFSLLGHYIGGAVALEIAAKLKTRVQKLILVSSIGTLGFPIPQLNENGEVIPKSFLTSRSELSDDILRVKPLQQVFDLKDYDFLENVLRSTIFNVTEPNNDLMKLFLNDAFTQKSIIDVYTALANFNISNKHNGVSQGNNKIEDITAETIVIQGSNDMLVPFDMAYTIKYSLRSPSKILTGTFGHSPFVDSPEWIKKTVFDFIK